MSSRADVEEIQATKTEKLLAVVLAAFLLLGAVWTYTRLDDVIRSAEPLPSATQSPAVQRFNHAQAQQFATVDQEQGALRRMVLAREAYRTALEAHRSAAASLGRQYDAAQQRYAEAKRNNADARRAYKAAQPAAIAAGRTFAARISAASDRQARDAFFARLGLVAVFIVAAFVLLARMRRRASRWFPLGGSVVAAATILPFVLASDYLTDYFDPFAWGVAFIALLGIVCTLLVYWALQRYLIRRLPQRRVRKHQCPFCGYPAGDASHCEGCGREIVASCTTCEAPRRVGTAHCAECGAAGTRA
jgi:hypothetical protein